MATQLHSAHFMVGNIPTDVILNLCTFRVSFEYRNGSRIGTEIESDSEKTEVKNMNSAGDEAIL